MSIAQRRFRESRLALRQPARALHTWWRVIVNPLRAMNAVYNVSKSSV
jgi:hypothetical protein